MLALVWELPFSGFDELGMTKSNSEVPDHTLSNAFSLRTFAAL